MSKRAGGTQEEEGTRRPWDTKSKILLGTGIALLVAAAIIIGVIVYGYLDARSRYDEAREVSGIDLSLFDDIFEGQAALEDIDVDWDALREINPDIVGWIYVENSEIDYPIVQGDDNDYYLHYSFDGSSSSSGAIFLDSDNSSDMTDENNLIYGHHMMDGSMFAHLVKYKDQEYLDENHRIIIVTPTRGYVLSPAFTYTVSGTDDSIRQLSFSSQEDLRVYIEDLMSRAVTESIVDLDQIDKLFSLITCSYETNDTRTVLCCVQSAAVTYDTEA